MEIKTVFAIWYNSLWRLFKKLQSRMVKKSSSNSKRNINSISTNKKAMKHNNKDKNSNSSNILIRYRIQIEEIFGISITIVKKQKKEIILRKNRKDRYILYLELGINFNPINRMIWVQRNIDNTIKLKVKIMRRHSKMFSLKTILQISINPSKILIFMIMKKMREKIII